MYAYETLQLKLQYTNENIDKSTTTISELNAGIQAIENEIADNYDSYAASLNDVSFSHIIYYRGTSQMELDQTIATNSEYYYELYKGILHTYGADIKTLS